MVAPGLINGWAAEMFPNRVDIYSLGYARTGEPVRTRTLVAGGVPCSVQERSDFAAGPTYGARGQTGMFDIYFPQDPPPIRLDWEVWETDGLLRKFSVIGLNPEGGREISWHATAAEVFDAQTVGP